MNNYCNPYSRLSAYYMVFSHDDDVDDICEMGMSIKQIHDLTGIPLKILRRDMMFLYQWQASIVFNEDSGIYKIAELQYGLEDLSLLEDGHIQPMLKRLFLDGQLDDIPLFLTNVSSKYEIGLTPDEAAALYSSYPEDTDSGQGESMYSNLYHSISKTYLKKYQIKDSYRYYHYCGYHRFIDGKISTINEALYAVNLAINNKKWLTIQYRVPPGSMQEISCMPLKIAYDSVENQYAILSATQDQIMVYYFDYITSICTRENKSTRDKAADIDASLLSRAPHVWGMDFNGSPEHVKIRFYHEANVWNKVRKDLSYRQGKLYEEDGYLYYEDTVYGIEKLKTWILGYGRSAIVLEPESLRQQIIDSLQKRLERLR